MERYACVERTVFCGRSSGRVPSAWLQRCGNAYWGVTVGGGAHECVFFLLLIDAVAMVVAGS